MKIHRLSSIDINSRTLFSTLLFFGGIGLFIYFAYWRLQLGLIRYFDVDEFLYLNWANHIKMGYLPYVDFMMMVTPLYVLLHIPIFFFAAGFDPFIIGRVIAFFISLSIAGLVGWLFWETKRSILAIVPTLTILVLPMPYDKYLEIRPDNLAIALFLLGLILQIKWMKNWGKKTAFLSGIFYALSILTLQKTLPYVVISVVVAGLSYLVFRRKQKAIHRSLFLFITGVFLPITVFIVWTILSGNPSRVIYSVVKLPVEHAAMYQNVYMRDFYFQPNATYYGAGGWSLGIIANHIFWIVGIAAAAGRLLWSVFAKRVLDLKGMLLSLLCISAVAVYYFSPINFPQYLIPASVFVAYFVGVAFWIIRKKIGGKKWISVPFWAGVIIFGLILFKVFNFVTFPKMSWTNSWTRTKLSKYFDMIPKGSYVFDLEGAMLYYPYPYYVCCLPIEDFRHYLSISLPSLKDALERTKTKYIYQGAYDSIRWLSPADVQFINDNYTSQDNGEFWVSKNW